MMFSDSYFIQGTGHEICEDYALHGINYTVLSDGCSNAGGPRIHTDFGARLLSKAAEQHITENNIDTFLKLISSTVQAQLRMFPGFDESCLTATLLTLKENKGNYRALVIGDGVVGGKRKDGQWEIHSVEYPRGPYYLKYKMFNETKKWKSCFGPKYKIRSYFGDILNEEIKYPQWDKQPPTYSERSDEWSKFVNFTEIEQDFSEDKPYNVFEFPVEDYEFVFIASDGMEAFQTPVKTQFKKYNEDLFLLDVVRVIMDFINVRPSFLTLQANWAFRQDKLGTLKRRNWLNYDDVSIGALHADNDNHRDVTSNSSD